MNLLDQKQAAGELRLSERTLERLRGTGTGPRYAKLGRRVLYRAEDLQSWIASRLRANTSEAQS